MGLVALVLADARFPGGGHVHSGGVEEAVGRGLVHDVPTLESFLFGRLRTAGLISAAFAAAASRVALACTDASTANPPADRPPATACTQAGTANGLTTDTPTRCTQASTAKDPAHTRAGFATLDAELDARTPSAAQRDASRAQGRGTLRAVRAAWPSPVLDELVAVHPRPHLPLLVGAVCGIAGEPAEEAARCVAYLAISGPASAAVRLLGLDPFAVNAALVRLGPVLDAVVTDAAHPDTGSPTTQGPDTQGPGTGRPGTAAGTAAPGTTHLPAPSAPVLDLLAQAHVDPRGERLRLFAS